MEMDSKETKKRGKRQFRIDLVLTVLFLAAIFYILFATIAFKSGLFGHMFYMKYVGAYLKDRDDYSLLDLLEASIASTEDYISKSLYGTDVLGEVNSSFQFALGKKLVNTGDTQMIRLNTGHLYDLQSKMSMEQGRDDVMSMRAIVPEETPFLFVYEHPTLYDVDLQMPEGYGFMDHGIEEADEIVRLLRDEGIEVMDSRDVLPASGVPMEDYLMYTDQHWSTRAALIMAQTIAGRIQELTGVDLHTERLDIDQFETTVYPKLFLGKYGQRVGTAMIDPDDIITYAPKYDTYIHFRSRALGRTWEKEGPFEVACIRSEVLQPRYGRTWDTRAYLDYGLTETYDIMTNDDGADCSILLLKDSYSAPIGRFLSLLANRVYAVDMRQNDSGTLQEWIDECDPDIVIVAYSLQMLRNEAYEFE